MTINVIQTLRPRPPPPPRPPPRAPLPLPPPAVARRDLARAYELVTPELRSGQSLAEWKRGTIAVVPYPVRRARLQPFKVVYSYSDRALLGVTFVPKPGEQI